ncbi:MAG: OmpH family outer membrane protein [Alcanivoracaceae bacterium]|jgi:outer membrane protein|nr:OmpH family outer membrane protein [Alcanivoracaceae bacterium]
MKTMKMLAAALLLLPMLAFAEPKIVVVDPERALGGTEEVKARISKFQSDMQGQENKLRKLRDDIMKIEERLKNEGVAMSRDQGQALTDERDAKMIEFRSLQQLVQQRLQQSQEELQAAMSPKLEKAVADLSKEKGYELVLVKQAVLFSSQSVDITDDVTKQINKMK